MDDDLGDHPLAGGLDEELARNRVLARVLGQPVEPVRVGDHILDGKLGSGGMGEVYAARPVGGGEAVALKTLSRAFATHLYRFKREFRALADATHPNLIRLHELGVTDNGRGYFTMELVDGEPFVAWVRRDTPAGELPELARLESALRQLLAGVQHLHRVGCIHRDLKPSNVLVDASGRVVILDFGLISELDEPEHGVTRDGQVLGTPAYMAPEQALGRRVGPAADFYALGVMLFECLTGELPRSRDGAELDLASALRHAPARLRQICAALLERDESRRMSGEALARALAAERRPSPHRPEVFVGRRAELAALHAVYEEVVEAGEGLEPVVAQLRGRSGQGKSTLLRQFRAQLRERGCLVFHGRCREREAVPYKALDAVIDEISAYLRRLPEVELAALQPRSAFALAEAFPVLAELWPDATVQPLTSRELRGVSWAALRELFEHLAAERLVALVIDDFQWADVDSVELLHELLRPPRSPKVLPVLSIRDDVEDSEGLRELWRDTLLGARAREIELGPLDEHEALALIERLAPERGESWAKTIALRSGGNPLFIEQVLRSGAADSELDNLNGLVAHRLAALDRSARRLLELVAIASGPLALRVAVQLCPTPPSQAEIDALVGAGLLVEGSVGSEVQLEVTHDRIREIALALLDADERLSLHLALAERLLAGCAEAPRGGVLLRIIEQLDAGLAAIDSLAPERRLVFARLACEAGELALRTGSHASARRDFGLARALADPWLEGLDPGRANYELSVAIWFGAARASAEASADAFFAELLRAPLTTSDYGRVVIERIDGLIHLGRVAEGCALQIEALRRLEVALPRRPSKLWALRRLAAGRRAYTRFGVEHLVELPEAPPGLERTIMEVMASAAIHWLTSEAPLWGLGLAGLHAELVVRHGFHDLAALGLAALGASLSLTQGADEMPRLLDSLAHCERVRPMSASDRAHLRLGLLLFGSRHRALRELAAEVEPAHRYCHETGQHALAAFMRNECASLYLDSGMSLAEVEDALDELHGVAGSDPADNDLHGFVRALIEGPELAPVPTPAEGDAPTSAYAKLVRAIEFDVLFGQFEAAAAKLRTIARDFERVFFGAYHLIPVYSMLSVIVTVERWPSTPARVRALKRKMLRKREATLARWAAECPDNFGAMSSLVSAELAALAGETEAAMRGYEDARKAATAAHNLWLVGLASARLASFSRRHHHTLTADAALLVAREAYHSWGARALVVHLDEELSGNDDLLALLSTRTE